MNDCHSGGKSLSWNIAFTGHSSAHKPQSTQTSGSMNSISAAAKPASSRVGWMQSHGQTVTHAVSFTPMQGSAITNAMLAPWLELRWHDSAGADMLQRHSLYKDMNQEL